MRKEEMSSLVTVPSSPSTGKSLTAKATARKDFSTSKCFRLDRVYLTRSHLISVCITNYRVYLSFAMVVSRKKLSLE